MGFDRHHAEAAREVVCSVIPIVCADVKDEIRLHAQTFWHTLPIFLRSSEITSARYLFATDGSPPNDRVVSGRVFPDGSCSSPMADAAGVPASAWQCSTAFV